MSWQCKKCDELNDDMFDACWKCKALPDGSTPSSEANSSPTAPIYTICATTNEIPNKKTVESKGIVCGEAIMGANMVRDLAAGIRNIVGGRAGMYESKLKQGRNLALSELTQEAVNLGANAVVGVRINYESLGQNMLMICATGTAIVIET